MPTGREATHAAFRAVIVIAVLLTAGGAQAQELAIGAEMQARGQDLLQRLQDGEALSVVAYGDSITDGWATEGGQVFHQMVIEALRHRFPDAEIASHVSGNPGWTTADALTGYARVMTGRDPDLILLQFGGNDRGWGRSLRDFRQDLARLLRRAVEESDAFVIACLPPWAEEIGDGRWALAAREAAAETGVPAAQFHRAIRESPHDFRGSFPWGSHPGSFTHVVMAKEVLRVFDAGTGAPASLRCELARGAVLSDEAEYTVHATIASDADEPLEWRARIEFGRRAEEMQGTLAPGEETTLSARFALPEGLPAGRSYAIPVALQVRSGSAGSFDAGRLTVAPALSAGPRAAWHELGGRSLVLGAHLWQGEDDLSGRFRTTVVDDVLRIEVQVVDDVLTVADLSDPSRGDSVEVYLDLRPRGEQGRPVYTEDVLALQVIPPSGEGAEARWRNMHALPTDLVDLRVEAELGEDGYRVEIDLPLSAIVARRGEDWGGIGLDVGINDADHGSRKSQMMWTGTGENYLVASCLAGVYPEALTERATRKALH